MTLVVEDGTGLANAESYASVQAATDYGTRMGLSWPSGATSAAQETALRRATAWIDATYRARFPGARVRRRLQALEWPRAAAYVRIAVARFTTHVTLNTITGATSELGYDYLPSDSVPPEVVNATIEAALREAANPGALMPDDPQGRRLKLQRAGDHEEQFFDNSSDQPSYPAIEAIIAPILASENLYVGHAVRS